MVLACGLYVCLIQFQSPDLSCHCFCSFKELAASRPLSEIRTSEEADLMDDDKPRIETPCLEGEFIPEGAEQPPDPAEELEKYITIREELYKKAKDFESKIIGFETAIRRPYFHVRPLDDPELENWHYYLDFIEKEDDINKVCISLRLRFVVLKAC